MRAEKTVYTSVKSYEEWRGREGHETHPDPREEPSETLPKALLSIATAPDAQTWRSLPICAFPAIPVETAQVGFLVTGAGQVRLGRMSKHSGKPVRKRGGEARLAL